MLVSALGSVALEVMTFGLGDQEKKGKAWEGKGGG